MDDENWNEMFDTILKREGNDFIQFLLDTGLDVNHLNKYGKTMLSYAAGCGNLETVEYLVRKGADVNVRNSDGSIPLHIAAKYGCKDIVECFLNKGIYVDSCDNDRWTPLHYAASEMDISLADKESYQELIRFLVARKANLNAQNRDKETPLLVAARLLREHIVELLIKLGSDVGYCDEDQWTVLHYSSSHGWSGIVRTLVTGTFDIDLNACNALRETPLITASLCSNKDVVQLLIDSGAEVNCKSSESKTVLHHSCEKGWLDVVKSLVVKGCDLNAEDIYGNTPLLLATYESNFSIVECLIESGADVNTCDLYGCTIFHHACREGWLNVVKSLIKKGCDLNAQIDHFGTPLHAAVQGPNLDVVEHLLKEGADCCVENKNGETAFNCFIQSRPCLEGIILFLENGAYIQPKDYVVISETPSLKEGVLQNVKLCTQAVINKFNNADLPEIYKIPVLSKRLPSIGKLKIVNNGNVAQNIAQSVKFEMQSKGCCNVLNVCPGALSILSVRSVIEYFVS